MAYLLISGHARSAISKAQDVLEISAIPACITNNQSNKQLCGKIELRRFFV
jgi:hypothetical protein